MTTILSLVWFFNILLTAMFIILFCFSRNTFFRLFSKKQRTKGDLISYSTKVAIFDLLWKWLLPYVEIDSTKEKVFYWFSGSKVLIEMNIFQQVLLALWNITEGVRFLVMLMTVYIRLALCYFFWITIRFLILRS